VIEPARTATGRRLYSGDEVRRLKLLREVVERGHLISTVAGKADGELRDLLDRDAGAQAPASGAESTADAGHLADAMAAVRLLDPDRLSRTLRAASLEMGVVGAMVRVLDPLLLWVGEAWRHGGAGIATEHTASVSVRRFLDWLLGNTGGLESDPVFAMATPPGERHEFGALMAGVVAVSAGFRVVYLGPDLPIEEIARGAVEVSAGTIGVSTVLPRKRKTMRLEAELLRSLLPPSRRLVWGGAASGAVAGVAGITVAVSLEELVRYLGSSAG
jgi:methanogenic corrinoid protein MtbC1